MGYWPIFSFFADRAEQGGGGGDFKDQHVTKPQNEMSPLPGLQMYMYMLTNQVMIYYRIHDTTVKMTIHTECRF